MAAWYKSPLFKAVHHSCAWCFESAPGIWLVGALGGGVRKLSIQENTVQSIMNVGTSDRLIHSTFCVEATNRLIASSVMGSGLAISELGRTLDHSFACFHLAISSELRLPPYSSTETGFHLFVCII